MANDRMYIRCKGCGDLHYLAKCYDDGYFTTHEGEELRQGLDDFFDRHKWCYRDKYYGGFELVYESDEDAENEGEDERIRKWLVNYFKAAGKSWIHRDISPEQILAWLEKQKEQKKKNVLIWGEPQVTITVQKQEWSEEDEKMLRTIISDGSRGVELDSKQISFLKSLRPSWKPSEEQMEALQNAVALTACDKELAKLYNQLKKL